MLWGYVWSPLGDEQRHPEQVETLTAIGIPAGFVVTERPRSPKALRPQLTGLLKDLRPQDVLVVVGLDALGTAVDDVLRRIVALADQGADLRVLEPAIDTRHDEGALLRAFRLLGEMGFGDRTLGEPAGDEAGARRPGRPRRLTEDQAAEARALHHAGLSRVAIAARLGVPRTTVYGYLP